MYGDQYISFNEYSSWFTIQKGCHMTFKLKQNLNETLTYQSTKKTEKILWMVGIDSPKNDSRFVVKRDMFPKNGFYQVDLEATITESGVKQFQ